MSAPLSYLPSAGPVDARLQLLDQQGAETETDTMSAHSHHPPHPDSPVLPHCLWGAAPAGRRTGDASLKHEGRWWR